MNAVWQEKVDGLFLGEGKSPFQGSEEREGETICFPGVCCQP